MTVKEYKHMMFMECSLVMTDAQAHMHMAIEAEHEAEAVAGGKYDVDPELVRQQQRAVWAKMPFQVWNNYITYHPSTDAAGSARMLVGGYRTRKEAEAFVASHYIPGEEHDDEQWFTIFPPKARTLPAPVALDECPF